MVFGEEACSARNNNKIHFTRGGLSIAPCRCLAHGIFGISENLFGLFPW